jgi:hypothetical protein
VLPSDGVLEARLAGGVHLWDVSHLLPEHPWRRYPRRDTKQIERVFVHHSGAWGDTGVEGFAELYRSTRYVVEQRDFPACAYPYWIDFEPDRDGSGAMCVYRGVPDELVAWSTGGANYHSTAVAFQGDLRETDPSDAQIECWEALFPWLQARFLRVAANGWRGLSWHSEADRWGGRAKPECPGARLESYVEGYRAGLATVP